MGAASHALTYCASGGDENGGAVKNWQQFCSESFSSRISGAGRGEKAACSASERESIVVILGCLPSRLSGPLVGHR